LESLSPTEALAALDLIEGKRKEARWICYYQPTVQQMPFYTTFKPDKKIFVLVGGNRAGKSINGAAVTAAWALGKNYFKDEPAWSWVQHLPIPEPPNNIWIVGLDYAVIRDVIWREKLTRGKDHPPFVPADPSVRRKVAESDFQIFFQNGSCITCKSADSGREKFQGASVDLVWIDEEPEEEIFDECYQRTADCGGKIMVTLTPLVDIASGIRTPWVYNLYEKFRAGEQDVQFTSLSVMDNPFVPEEEKKRLRIKWAGHVEEEARLYGKFVQRSGLIYNTWDRKKHLINPFRVSRAWRSIVVIDPAATGVTAGLWGKVSPEGDLYLIREYYEKNKIVSEHAKDILVRNLSEPVDIWLIDPKWGSQRNAETHRTNAQLYKDAGIPVRLAPVDNDFGLNESREYVSATVTTGSRHPKVYVFRDLENFIFEIEHYTWSFFSRGELKGLSKDKPMKRNDHLLNAFQYLCALRPRGRQAQEPDVSLAKFQSYT